jgi:uncharacterized Zn finger protein
MTWQEDGDIIYKESDWQQEYYKCLKCGSNNSLVQRTMFKSTKNVFCERRCMDCKAVTFGAEFPVEDGKNDYIF